MRYIPDDNLKYPALVKIGGGNGSGFYFRTDNKVFLVTARHVLFDINDPNLPLRGSVLELVSYDDINFTTKIEIKVDLNIVPIRKNDAKDIAVVEIANIQTNSSVLNLVNGVEKISGGSGTFVVAPSSLLKKFDQVLVSNEVFIIGYPSSLGDPNQPQIESDKPLLRKGIVAGLNLAQQTIILDCPVYFGNSGGIVIEVEHSSGTMLYRIIGVVSQFVPFIEKFKSMQLGYINKNYENSGYSIAVPIDTIIELTAEAPTQIETN